MPSIEVDDDAYLRISLRIAKSMLSPNQNKNLDAIVERQLNKMFEEE